MTEKQKRFCDEYLIDCNATQAAIRAGYSKKTAVDIGHENLNKPKLKAYIEERLHQMQSDRISESQEVMQYLTSVMRGEAISEEVVIIRTGNGCSEAIRIMRYPTCSERIRAAELIGKRYGLFKGDIKAHVESVIIIHDDVVE